MVPTSAEPLLVTADGPVATLWLNRPAKRNAITLEMWRGMPRLLAQLADDPAVRVLVVRGMGEHFSAGADIGELGAELADPERGPAYRQANRAAEEALADFPRPTLAVVQGSCIGAGCEVAVACDLRLAESRAQFGITPARLGIVYPGFALERVVKLIGAAASKHLLFSGEFIDTTRALRIGLVDEVHESAALEERLRTYSATLAERSLLTQRAAKEMIGAVVDHGTIDAELTRAWEREALAAPDGPEGVRAFAERRPARFTWTRRREPGSG